MQEDDEITAEDIAQLYKAALYGTPTQKKAAITMLAMLKRMSDDQPTDSVESQLS